MIRLLMMVLFFLVTVSPVSSVLAQKKPQYGGTMRIINAMGPKVLGYIPEMGPTDVAAIFPAVESLMEMNENRKIVPFLARSVEFNDRTNVVTIKLNEGIRFHDGSLMTADVIAWNYQLMIDNKKLQFAEMIKSINVIDSYTLEIQATGYNNQLEYAWGWVQIFSKAAFETHGKEWCRTHVIGTGPFELASFKRDVSLKWKKFENYWQHGLPYLDALEVTFIPDSVTASSMMLAKAADLWLSAEVKDQAELVTRGLTRNAYWTGLPAIVYLNVKDEDKPTANRKVRHALEYAIDKNGISKAIGYGYYKPLKTFHPEGDWAYDPDYDGRPYNPEKARKLLAEAGFKRGLKLDLLALNSISGGQVTAEAIKAYLGDVGVQVHIDMADPGRYWGSVFGRGWNDMALSFTGIAHNSLGTFQSWFGHQPKSHLSKYQLTPRLKDLSIESITIKDEVGQEKIMRQMALEIADQALFIPLFYQTSAYLTQPWVHTNYLETGLIRWKMFDMWMEKH